MQVWNNIQITFTEVDHWEGQSKGRIIIVMEVKLISTEVKLRLWFEGAELHQWGAQRCSCCSGRVLAKEVSISKNLHSQAAIKEEKSEELDMWGFKGIIFGEVLLGRCSNTTLRILSVRGVPHPPPLSSLSSVTYHCQIMVVHCTPNWHLLVWPIYQAQWWKWTTILLK